jgi:octanoyl-[GcvH]:protein N-octanoyltransferase
MQPNAHKPALSLIRTSFPDRPAFGTAVSEAILRRVAAGELGPTLRLHRPARELAFSKQDAASTGFAHAVEAARRADYEPVVRLAGGRAAVFHEHSLALAWASPDRWPARHTRERFELVSGVVAGALARLGIDARVGEIPGEYCPGAWSVNARGRTKLVGIGQRLISGAAHVGAVVVVGGDALLRDVLVPVYAALELEWDPATAGSVAAELGAASLDDVEAALLAELGGRFELRDAELEEATLTLAAELEEGHRPSVE